VTRCCCRWIASAAARRWLLNWPCSPAAAGCPTRLCLAITFDPAGAALPACSGWDYATAASPRRPFFRYNLYGLLQGEGSRQLWTSVTGAGSTFTTRYVGCPHLRGLSAYQAYVSALRLKPAPAQQVPSALSNNSEAMPQAAVGICRSCVPPRASAPTCRPQDAADHVVPNLLFIGATNSPEACEAAATAASYGYFAMQKGVECWWASPGVRVALTCLRLSCRTEWSASANWHASNTCIVSMDMSNALALTKSLGPSTTCLTNC
jgi:hypothetical protein